MNRFLDNDLLKAAADKAIEAAKVWAAREAALTAKAEALLEAAIRDGRALGPATIVGSCDGARDSVSSSQVPHESWVGSSRPTITVEL
jgi:hypothetical protein